MLGHSLARGQTQEQKTPSPAPAPRSLCACWLLALDDPLDGSPICSPHQGPTVSVTNRHDRGGRSLILLFSEGRAYLRGRVQSAFTRLAIEALSDTELTLQTTTPILNCFERRPAIAKRQPSSRWPRSTSLPTCTSLQDRERELLLTQHGCVSPRGAAATCSCARRLWELHAPRIPARITRVAPTTCRRW